MSGLLFLSSDDFTIQKGSKGNIMCHSISGFSLILFYSKHCVHCQDLIPIFAKLPGTINGCQFGMINISTNRKCVNMSNSTIAPITYVPYIVLYYEGRPYMVYKGPYHIQEIQKFVFEVANNLQKKQQFMRQDPRSGMGKGSKNRRIPDYTVGIPVYGDGNDNVCYLTMPKAYKKNK